MTTHVDDCPRCKAKSITFDVLSGSVRSEEFFNSKDVYLIDVSLQCRNCHGTSVIQCSSFERNAAGSLSSLPNTNGRLDERLRVSKFLTLANVAADLPPEHLPPNIASIYGPIPFARHLISI